MRKQTIVIEITYDADVIDESTAEHDALYAVLDHDGVISAAPMFYDNAGGYNVDESLRKVRR